MALCASNAQVPHLPRYDRRRACRAGRARSSGLVRGTLPDGRHLLCRARRDAEPFVEVGRRVKKGDTLCVIEAMKLMNEITAEQDGTIVEICAQNGQAVEYGTPLFRYEGADMDREELMTILPHRDGMLLLDRVEREEDCRARLFPHPRGRMVPEGPFSRQPHRPRRDAL